MKCEQCGQDKDDVGIVTDPYAADVLDEEVEMQLCGDCYRQRADDI
jgi:hypothetical protein